MGGKSHRAALLSATGKLIWVVVMVVAFLLYGGALLSPSVSPLKTQIPAFLNLSFPVLLLGIVLLLVCALIMRLWRSAVACLLLLLLSGGYILTYFPLHRTSLSEERDLRVVSYNVANMALTDEEGVPRALRILEGSDADVICLQEGISPEQIGRYGKECRQFLSRYPYRRFYADDRLLLLSRFDIIDGGKIDYKSYANGSAWYLLRISPDRSLLLVNNHMESYSLGSEEKETFRGYLTKPSLDEMKSRLLAIKRRLGPSLNVRAGAANAVRDKVRSLQRDLAPTYTIICGDFNDTPMSYCYSRIRDDRNDAFVQTGRGMGVSFNEPLYAFRIDHLFYEGPLRAMAAEIPSHKDCSDHNPLLVDFKTLDTKE